jgi:hypothetical protein
MEILERFTDDAGKYRTIINLGERGNQVFKFDETVSDDFALDEATKFLASLSITDDATE